VAEKKGKEEGESTGPCDTPENGIKADEDKQKTET
jgi:hypothetical protein